jgi:hypothetical protein
MPSVKAKVVLSVQNLQPTMDTNFARPLNVNKLCQSHLRNYKVYISFFVHKLLNK